MLMNKNYYKIQKQIRQKTTLNKQRNNLDNWKDNIFRLLLHFYLTYDKKEIKNIISQGGRVEDNIACYMVKFIKELTLTKRQGFIIQRGVNNNNSNNSGLYDVTICHSDWKKKDDSLYEFHFECKNLDKTPASIRKYIFFNKKECGVYRFFNGKYASDQTFGGMIGFVLSGNLNTIKNNIQVKLYVKFDITPDGDLISITHNSIANNLFTFDSIHLRNSVNFTLHHLLFDFT